MSDYVDSKRTNIIPTYVYILWDYSKMPQIDDTKIKIGRSINPEIRCKNIITQSGMTYCKPYIYLKCKDKINSEKSIHKLLNQYRGVGEWFYISPFKAISLIINSGLFETCFELGIKPKELE